MKQKIDSWVAGLVLAGFLLIALLALAWCLLTFDYLVLPLPKK